MSIITVTNRILTTSGGYTPPPVGTQCVWVVPLGITGTQRLLGNSTTWEWRIDNEGQLYNEFYASGTGPIAPNPLQNNVLYHICSTFDVNGTIETYINGEFVVQGTANSGTGTADLSIGVRTGTTNFFAGLFSDCRVYSRKLTPQEIRIIYAYQGNDDVVQGLQNKWLLNSKAPGQTVTSVPDYGVGGKILTPPSDPVIYAELISGRRGNSQHYRRS